MPCSSTPRATAGTSWTRLTHDPNSTVRTPVPWSVVEAVRRAYGRLAGRYIELFGVTSLVPADDLALIDRRLSIRPGTVLDVGCGPGHLTEYLRSRDVEAIGVDVVPTFIEHARTAHPHGRYLLGSMDRLPIADHSVAGVLAWYSLIHVPPDDLDGVLTELRRSLAPAGALVAGFFDGAEIAAFEHQVITAWSWPFEEFSARLRAAGFAAVERHQRPAQGGHRAHAAIVAVAAGSG